MNSFYKKRIIQQKVLHRSYMYRNISPIIIPTRNIHQSNICIQNLCTIARIKYSEYNKDKIEQYKNALKYAKKFNNPIPTSYAEIKKYANAYKKYLLYRERRKRNKYYYSIFS